MSANDIRSGALLFRPLSLLLLLPLLLSENVALSIIGQSNNEPKILDQTQSQMVQNTNLYLINLDLKLDAPDPRAHEVTAKQADQMDEIRAALREARQELAMLMGDIIQKEHVDKRFKPLLTDIDLAELFEFLYTLSQTSEHCDQVTLDFFLILSNFNRASTTARDGHLLVQNYAKLHVTQCWRQFVQTAAHRIDIQMGKMILPVFKNIEQIVARMRRREEENEEQRKRRMMKIKSGATKGGSIKIDDSKASKEDDDDKQSDDPDSMSSSLDSESVDELKQTIERLKLDNLDTYTNTRLFAMAVNQLHNFRLQSQQIQPFKVVKYNKNESVRKVKEFYEEFVARPCQDLVSRVQATLSEGNIYESNIWQTLGTALTNEKATNPRLDYELHVYKICKEVGQKSDAILDMLAKMR